MTEFAVEVTRTIPGPRAEVYRAFLDPDVLQKWFCPGEFAVVTASVDEHVGGRHVVEMLAPDGMRLAFESVIRDLVENERIVLDFAFVGPEPGERVEHPPARLAGQRVEDLVERHRIINHMVDIRTRSPDCQPIG